MRKAKLEPPLPGPSFKSAYLLMFIQSNCQTGLYSNSDLYEYALKTVILEKLGLEYFLIYFFAKHIIVGLLFKNIHPLLQYSSRSLIQTSFFFFFLFF